MGDSRDFSVSMYLCGGAWALEDRTDSHEWRKEATVPWHTSSIRSLRAFCVYLRPAGTASLRSCKRVNAVMRFIWR